MSELVTQFKPMKGHPIKNVYIYRVDGKYIMIEARGGLLQSFQNTYSTKDELNESLYRKYRKRIG